MKNQELVVIHALLAVAAAMAADLGQVAWSKIPSKSVRRRQG
jgi:hypothetical protein